MNNKTIIQGITNYIESHLSEELTLGELAELAHYSEYHFHRMFQFFTGTTVMCYIRSRRLARAAFLIMETDHKMLDIALECGFRNPETFSRNFRKAFGIMPSELRRNKDLIPDRVLEAMNLSAAISYGQLPNDWRDWSMEFKQVTFPATRIIGYRIETTVDNSQNNKDIPAFWQHYIQNKLWDNIPGKLRNVELGVCTASTEDGKFGYVIGYEVAPETAVPEGLVEYHIPEHEYAVFTTPKADPDQFVDSIQNTWNYVFSEWFPSSGFEHAEAPEMEWYDERCMTDTDKQIDIYIPIKPAAKTVR